MVPEFCCRAAPSKAPTFIRNAPNVMDGDRFAAPGATAQARGLRKANQPVCISAKQRGREVAARGVKELEKPNVTSA